MVGVNIYSERGLGKGSEGSVRAGKTTDGGKCSGRTELSVVLKNSSAN